MTWTGGWQRRPTAGGAAVLPAPGGGRAGERRFLHHRGADGATLHPGERHRPARRWPRSPSTARWRASARWTRISARRRASTPGWTCAASRTSSTWTSTAGERVTRLTGCPPTCDHGPKMLWWQHERPEEYARIAKFVTPAGYVAGRMAGLRGEQAFMDYTFIHFSGFQRCPARDLVGGAVRACWRGHGQTAEIVEPWRVIGR